ncbi:MAG: Cu(I)-responsive transcriptional regulator [Moraxellaceae bacterium]|nr:Cu(I)-responsive transcriptional regulator [Moraxellaceae bacterium]MDZ4387759.1 Cu(I)-responsive transcriptional regulator [Moraxellaceae bacterium]
MTQLFSIGQAAKLTALSVKMIRHYESIGLITPSARTEAQYRLFSEEDLHRLHFIRRARRLGFAMTQVAELLTLWQGHRPSREVKQLALTHINELDQRIIELQAMRDTLSKLAERCHGDQQPSCPILADLQV